MRHEVKALSDKLTYLGHFQEVWPLVTAVRETATAERQAELSSITANYETAQANWDLCLDTINELQAENERLKAVLKNIASCTSHHPADVVALARQALGEKT